MALNQVWGLLFKQGLMVCKILQILACLLNQLNKLEYNSKAAIPQ